MPRILDVRRLPPPEPLELILDTLTDMPKDERLWVVHGREPFPLYDLLRRLGYDWQTRGSEACFKILIWPTDQPPTSAELEWNPPC